jgi:hypothetical protein
MTLILTADSPFYNFKTLHEMAKDGLVKSVAYEWYKKHFTVQEALNTFTHELDNQGGNFRKTELFKKHRGCKTWDQVCSSYKSILKAQTKKASAKANQIWGGCCRQSKLLKLALQREHTFYREDGTVVKVSQQKSATDIYYILKEHYETDAAVQGLARMLRNGRGSFVGWTLTKPYNAEQKHLYTKVERDWANPEVKAEIYSLESKPEDPNLHYACQLNKEIVELSLVLDPVTRPIKGGATLKACLEKVIVLSKGNKSIIVQKAKNLSVVARETGISLAALRHLIYMRCKTANGWTMQVFR